MFSFRRRTSSAHSDDVRGSVDLSRDALSYLPSAWSPSPDPSGAKLFLVTPGTDEFNAIATAFHSSVDSNVGIISAHRIENLSLWRSYLSKRSALLDRAASEKADFSRYEKIWLFHGSDADVAEKVCEQGLNRSFAGRHATAYGKGVYLARDASYSARTTYSRPDHQGVQQMFLCRAVVGECCKGSSGQVVPDVRVANTNKLYDSTVDRTSNPSIFVTYNDAQVYPEYLIKFRRGERTPPYSTQQPPRTERRPVATPPMQRPTSSSPAAGSTSAPTGLAAEQALRGLWSNMEGDEIKDKDEHISMLCDAIYTGTWSEAADWFPALEQHPDHPLALAALGHCREKGMGTRIDADCSAELYNRVDVELLQAAASAGNAHAQFHFGRMLLLSRGQVAAKVPANLGDRMIAGVLPTLILALLVGSLPRLYQSLAVYWFALIASVGIACALLSLALPQFLRARRAMGWFRLAAESGHAHAQCSLGLCYYNQDGTLLNREVAVEWFRKSSAQGCAHAQYALGYCYNSTGRGVTKDRVKAVEWFEKAAEQGHPNAQFSFARCWELGKGVRKNDSAAVEWHRKSADLGHSMAAESLAKGLLDGTDLMLTIASRKTIWESLKTAP